MKIYESKTTPNARRVRIFLAEKGIDMDYVQVDIEAGENLSDEFRKKNPTTKIPVLELDDGSCISESGAICRYFEELHPDNPLMGSSPKEKAEIEMWHRRIDWYLMIPVGSCFQHTTGFFKDRMKPIAEWGEESGKAAQNFLQLLEDQLAESSYIAGENFSIADIAALCALDFARVVKIRPSAEQIHLQRWLDIVKLRPSVKA